MSLTIDLFANPKALFAPDFVPYRCSVLGIKIGDPASTLEGWETEDNEHGWSHMHGGVGFKVREGVVYQIKLPQTFYERLELKEMDDLLRILGFYDDMRRIIYRDSTLMCGYLWNKGILMWWQLLPQKGPSHMVLFDPAKGVPRDSINVSYVLDSGEQCHGDAPSTFELPPRERRESLIKGDLVKLMFRIKVDDKEYVERMWVGVTEVKSEAYVGVLDNDPYCTSEIRSGLRVEFNADHVIQVWCPPS
jgi:Uncharacterized protein conserved in bacteria (DUF2314)